MDWKLYLTRPFSIFGASLWQEWYNSAFFGELLGFRLSRVLYVEDHKNVVRSYRPKKQLEKYTRAIELLIRRRPETLKKLFRQAELQNRQAKRLIARDPKAFVSLEDANAFLIKLALCGTAIPYRVSQVMETKNIKNKALAGQVEKLRAVSFYPDFIKCVMEPLAEARIGKNRAHWKDLLTYQEIIGGRLSLAASRKAKHSQGRHFIFQSLEGKEKIRWLKDTSSLIEEIEDLKLSGQDAVKGQVAYQGLVKGKVRLVLSNDLRGQSFKKGEILVTLNSNPTLMPFLVKAAALVTDDGGLACHAAIISRELKLPCVMGTKIATKIFKNGDLVEVDAVKGIVKILK